MTMIQIGPTAWMDEKRARKKGLKPYTAPKAAPAPSKRAKAPSPVKAATEPTAQRAAPRDIPAAIRRGLNNSEIDALIKDGKIERPDIATATRSWAPADVHAARCRGLIR